ncbi:BREX-2 system adenine-specific DNA-methyltransferase PglX [Nonomuraea roseola]|uniref:site-specific DNA-methyltransferase (adenine-specific) n=1 Tax=Nonomuraea roseola TaxID=46179 RepID=A0ABV5Q199_9ACTN
MDPRTLLRDLRARLAVLTDDLSAQANAFGAEEGLRSEWAELISGRLTTATYSDWRAATLSETATAWLLGTVLLRFAEDNTMISEPYLSGPDGPGLAAVREAAFFRQNPTATARDWLLAGFADLSVARPMAMIFDPATNPLGRIPLSHEAAVALIAFWRSGHRSFADPALDTGFLRDLYQGLSETASRTYALLPTPEFVADLVLDQTLDPAIQEHGLDALRLIDPACGSGTFLLLAFNRLADYWKRSDPALTPEERSARVLRSLHGVDKYPNATLISRFRLLIVAMRESGIRMLRDTDRLLPIIATGDVLLAGRPWPESDLLERLESPERRADDVSAFADNALLAPGSYHAVVGNPPYLAVADKAESLLYRRAYPVSVGRYALTVPFTVRFFELAIRGTRSPGHVGILLANSFMKREFGRRLITDFLPTVDLRCVVDTSGAYIPGHGTPTVLLFGVNQTPEFPRVQIVLGLKGEPSVPDDPAQGHVWRGIRASLSDDTRPSAWMQNLELDRSVLTTFPWNLAGTDTTAILQAMDTGDPLADHVRRIGYRASTGADDILTASPATLRRIKAEPTPLVPVISGSGVRDWRAVCDRTGIQLGERAPENFPHLARRLWPYRTLLGQRRSFGGTTYFAEGRPWYSWHQISRDEGVHPWSIVFSWVSTHNHFAIVRTRATPLNSAPVIEFDQDASGTDIVRLNALLNSSLLGFWLKRHSNSKGQPRTDQTGSGEPWTLYYEFTGTRTGDVPLPHGWQSDRSWNPDLPSALDALAAEAEAADPLAVLAGADLPSEELIENARLKWTEVSARMAVHQEELDWHVYSLYGLCPPDLALRSLDELPSLVPGERPFEILLARAIAAGRETSDWFSRHGRTATTEVPARWPESYRTLVERRISAISSTAALRVLESPEYKRRWTTEDWQTHLREAAGERLITCLEERDLWYENDGSLVPQPRIRALGWLLEELGRSARVARLASLAAPGKPIEEVLTSILTEESVPFLAAMRLTETGLRKRRNWEEVWDAQRQEDMLTDEAEIQAFRVGLPVPPRYTSADFLRPSYWRARGKNDIANEAFISYPSGSGVTVAFGWAGWNALERGTALALHALDAKSAGVEASDLIPQIAGLAELQPWIDQWHGTCGTPEGARADELRHLRRTLQDQCGVADETLRAWRPPKPRRGRPPKKRG